MLKNILYAGLVALTISFSACGGSNDGETALETQQMLDNGEFDAVIARVEGHASTKEDYLTLGAAYMGKAGFSLASIVGIVAASATGNGGDEFSVFIDNASQRSTPTALTDLDTAVGYYQKVIQNRCLDLNATLGAAEKDLCLYVGLANVSSTAVTISYITDDVAVLSDPTAAVDYKLNASTCAMQYAFDGTKDGNCTFSSESNVTFIQSNRNYADINITVNADTNNTVFEYLITPPDSVTGLRSTAVTKGKCTLADFATRVDDSNATDYFPCPIIESSDSNISDLTTESILVKALNDGLDSIGSSASPDVQSDIDSFKEEILVANGRSINDANTTITTEDIIVYLNSNN